MKKKEYIKPEQQVVMLQHNTQLMADSTTLTDVSTTGLDDNLSLDGEEAGAGFWGR